jgi:glycosyltransferase involved in cell wall biosynthesis
MRICIISHDYPPFKEGRGYAVERIVKKLVKKGFNIHIVTRMEKENFLDSVSIPILKENGVYVHRIMHKSFGKESHNPNEINKVIFFIKKLDEKYNFDMFHGIGIFPCGFIAVNCAKELKKRSIVSGRGSDINLGVYKKEDFAIVKWTLENADKLIFVSKTLLEKANIFYDCSKKSSVIHNSLDPSEFLYSRKINLPLSDLNIGIIGIIRNGKGFDYLLHAFKKLRKKRKAKLFVIGFFENNSNYLEKDVFVTGYIEKKYILNYISKMDIVVIPSFLEGCPNSLLEAMYCKKAIIGSKTGAIAEIIENGKNGILIEPFSSEAIYQNILKLADNPRFRIKLGNEAYKKIKNNFLLDSELEKISAVYSSISKDVVKIE